MFRHKNHAAEEVKKITEAPVAVEEHSAKAKDVSPSALRELLEKNLKWSQIIYEQNRRINSKLFWQALAGWIRLFIIVVPIILAVIFLPPILSDVWKQYQNILQIGGVSGASKVSTPPSLEKILKLLPLDPAQQEQLKAYLK